MNIPVETENFTPSYLFTLLENYGWFLLGGVILLLLLFFKAKPKIDKYLEHRENQLYSEKYHKDEEATVRRLQQQKLLVDKLQEKYNRDAEEYERKQKENEKRKREELLEKLNVSGSAQRLGSHSDSSNKSFKPEYNPLMGSGGTNYRPQRKKGCPGGGCGK